MRRKGEGEALVVVGGGGLVIRGFLETSGEFERRLRFRSDLCFFDFLSRCLWGGVESIVFAGGGVDWR